MAGGGCGGLPAGFRPGGSEGGQPCTAAAQPVLSLPCLTLAVLCLTVCAINMFQEKRGLQHPHGAHNGVQARHVNEHCDIV